MNNRNKKRLKRIVGCISALAMFLGSIPMNAMQAKAEETTTPIYYDVADEEYAFQLHGVTYDATAQLYRRMDLATAAEIAGVTAEVNAEEEDKKYSFLDSEGEFKNNVYSHAREAAGGRIRFSTASSYVSIKATLYNWDYTYAKSMEDGKYGFDVYVDTADGSTYAGTVSVAEYPKANGEVTLEGTVDFGSVATRNLTIYFPITIETKSVQIGVSSDCTIEAHAVPYEADQELVFYGSSITQGGAVSKPGNTYVNTVGRNLNMDYHSYGVWGSAKGQIGFAEYIAQNHQDMTAFVFDYDHNNSTVLDLDGTKDSETKEWSTGEYYPFYETIRAVDENMPIILVTRPNNNLDAQHAEKPGSYSTTAEMKAFIRAAYEKAKAEGDENIHFIDGETFFDYSKGYLEDNVHPNDAGQARMAAVVQNVLERALDGETNICIASSCDELVFSEDFESYADDTSFIDATEGTWITKIDKKIAENSLDENFKVITNGNDKVYQLQYSRKSNVAPTGCYIWTSDAVIDGDSKVTVEMDATLYKTEAGKWSYLGLTLATNKISPRIDVRIQPTTDGCKVTSTDRSDGDNLTMQSRDGDGVLANLAVGKTDTSFSYHVKVEAETVLIPDGSEVLVLAVYINNEEPVIFEYALKSADFVAKKIGVFLFSTSTEEYYTAAIDDIKVYQPRQHTIKAVAEIPATPEGEGKDAHFVCSSCGQQFLDANGVLKTTDAELINAKTVACTTLYTNEGPATNNVTDFNLKGLEVTNVNNEAWELTGNHGKYAILEYHKDSVDDATIMNANNNFGFKMDTTLYRDAGNNWTYTGIMFRKANGTGAGTYEIRIKPTAKGYTAYLLQSDISGSVDSKAVVDDKFASAFEEGTEISYQIRIVASFNSDSTNASFCIYVDDHAVIVLRPDTPITSWVADTTRIYLRSETGGTELKAVVDNIEAYETKHTTSYVAEIPATETTVGTKAHYACSECNQKFLDEACTVVASDEELTIPKRVFCIDLCEVEGLQMDPNSTSGWDPNNYCTVEQGEDGVEAKYSGTGSQSYMATITGFLNKQSDWSFKTKATIYRKDSENWSYVGFWFRRPSTLGYEIQLLPTAEGYTLQLMDRTSGAIGTTYTRTVTDEKFAAAFADAEANKLSYNLHVIMDGDENHTNVKFYVWVDSNAVEIFEIVPDVTGTVYPTGIRAWLYSTDGSVGHKIALDNTEIYKTTHNVTAVEATLKTEEDPGMKAHYLCSDCGKRFMDEDATLAYAELTDILCQTRQNKDNPNNTDIRFVTYVDGYTQYSGVKFTITRGDKSGSRTTTKVYASVNAAGEIYTPEDVYGVTEGHFATFILGNNTADQLKEEMTVTVTFIARDGSEIPGTSRTRTIQINK